MSRPKKNFSLPRLHDCYGILSRTWYVEYSIRNLETDKLERTRIYDGLTGSTTADRLKNAKTIIAITTKRIKDQFDEFKKEADLLFYDRLEFNIYPYKIKRKVKQRSVLHRLFSDYLDEKETELTKKSMQNYVSKLRRFWDWLECNDYGLIEPKDISRDLVIEYLHSLVTDEKLCRVTIKKYKLVLHTFCVFLKRKHFMVSNPAEDISPMGKVIDCSPYPIPRKHRLQLAKVIREEDPQLWLGCCLQYYTAIRPGEEMRTLRIGQINMKSRKIRISSANSKNNDTETIDMPTQLYDVLVDYNLEQYPDSFYLLGKGKKPNAMCLSQNTLTNRFNVFRDKLWLPNTYKFYSWKHSGAEELADMGLNTWELQAHLRHKSITTTEHYVRKRLGTRNSRIKNDFPDI